MKWDIIDFVTKFQKIWHVKYEYQKPTGIFQRIPIPIWEWERVIMDFIVGVPKTLRKYDYIRAIVDWLTRSVHFYSGLSGLEYG